MASMTSMFTGLSGLATNARRLDVIGNNIANVNTTSFKSNRALFSPNFSRNFSMGTAPGALSGGSNPMQVGLGVTLGSTQRNFESGAISPTGVSTDIAIEGDGFFIIRDAGQRVYTRAGSFQRNSANDLVTATGANVMGFAVDDNFQVQEGNLVPLNIPIGTLTVAEATQNVVFNGNLDASGMVGMQGSSHVAQAMFTTNTLTGGTEMDGTEDLTVAGTDLWIDDGTGTGTLAIEGGENTVITISGIEKDGKDLGTFTFGFMDAATAAARGVDGFGSTMNDFIGFLEQVLGLDNTTINGQSLGGGISIGPDGVITINGNEGTAQALDITSASFTAVNDSGTALSQPFVMADAGKAEGESVRTSFVVYDSLGSPMTVDLTFVLQETTTGNGTIWQFIAESSDNDAIDRIVGLGVVEFDSEGRFVDASNDQITLMRGNGATNPQAITLDFDSDPNAISALADTASNLAAIFQDGSQIGTLSDFAVDGNGTIIGSFSNGLTRTVGQLALANFANPGGLVDIGDNMFATGANSGEPVVARPTEFGTGRLVGGALELSNVDLSEEFINMILASTGYSASSRVISTTNELIQQLLVLGR